MKLKYNILTICVFGLMGYSFISCSDILDVKPLNEIVLENFWNEESDVNNVVAGCYSAMQTQATIDRMMVWGECRSENIIGGSRISDDVNLSNIFKENIKATNPYTTWVDFYNVINRCNTVLKYAPTVAEKDPKYTQSKLKATEAEVSALRDLCYFYLIRTFRDVPYTTEAFVDDNQTMALPASSFDVVLDNLIADLESVQRNAIKKYPEANPEYQHGRITQDAIHAMLCEMYLWKQDYANAIKYADMVIDSKKKDYEEEVEEKGETTVGSTINGFPLINDSYSTTGNSYGSAATSIFGTGNSKESIFELIFENNDNMMSNGAVSARYGNAKYPLGFFSPSDLITAEHDQASTRNKVFNKHDMRPIEYQMLVSGSAYSIIKYAMNYVLIDMSGTTPSIHYSGFYPETLCHANWIIYRLTDIMLMKAEAMAMMLPESASSTSETLDSMRVAFNIINAVNKRSYGSKELGDTLKFADYQTKSALENLVYDERNRELMFEGKRWYDLVRRSRRDGNTSYLIEQVTRKGSTESSVVSSKLSKMDAIYWPYNYDELKVNTNLVQNPAFSSGEDESYSTTNK